jgi:non-homologous end joining protein Ku
MEELKNQKLIRTVRKVAKQNAIEAGEVMLKMTSQLLVAFQDEYSTRLYMETYGQELKKVIKSLL